MIEVVSDSDLVLKRNRTQTTTSGFSYAEDKVNYRQMAKNYLILWALSLGLTVVIWAMLIMVISLLSLIGQVLALVRHLLEQLSIWSVCSRLRQHQRRLQQVPAHSQHLRQFCLVSAVLRRHSVTCG